MKSFKGFEAGREVIKVVEAVGENVKPGNYDYKFGILRALLPMIIRDYVSPEDQVALVEKVTALFAEDLPANS